VPSKVLTSLTGPDDILIRLNFTGLCSSDIHMMQGDLGMPPMSTFGVRSPGHEGAGVVVKLGANVKNFKLGDRAGIKPIADTCGSCNVPAVIEPEWMALLQYVSLSSQQSGTYFSKTKIPLRMMAHFTRYLSAVFGLACTICITDSGWGPR
jgi:D-arabinose 1-dehydrogenase-like Zn-dependent alcohol dehydrogenase